MHIETMLYRTIYKVARMYLTIYVDDIIIACKNLAYVLEVKVICCKNFDMTDMGALEHFLNGLSNYTSQCIPRRCWNSFQTSLGLLRRPGRALYRATHRK